MAETYEEAYLRYIAKEGAESFYSEKETRACGQKVRPQYPCSFCNLED